MYFAVKAIIGFACLNCIQNHQLPGKYVGTFFVCAAYPVILEAAVPVHSPFKTSKTVQAEGPAQNTNRSQ